MRALSIRQPWASLIARGVKTIETRTWSTRYRGPLLILASKSPRVDDLPAGVLLCETEILECRPMTIEDQAAACVPWRPGLYAWTLGAVKSLPPIPCRGKLGLFSLDL